MCPSEKKIKECEHDNLKTLTIDLQLKILRSILTPGSRSSSKNKYEYGTYGFGTALLNRTYRYQSVRTGRYKIFNFY
jgi:hypothetical protein